MYLYDCKTDHRINPVGIDAKQPRFSWKLQSSEKNVLQTSYRVIVGTNMDFREICWDSGKIISEQSQSVRYEGQPLKSCSRYYWKVYCAAGDENAESKVNFFEMGILDPHLWKAKWIEPEKDVDIDLRKPASYLRKCFYVREGLVRARIYQSAHGIYHFWINGSKGTEDMFNPGFTSYYHRIQYQTCDITQMLQRGENTWAVVLGDGWWRGTTGGAVPNNFGYKTALLGQIVLEYENGESETIISDEQFRTSYGAWLATDMREGEVYNALLEPSGWKLPGFDDSHWSAVQTASEYNTLDTLIPSRSAPVHVRESFEGRVVHDAYGDLVIDFGQNIAGIVQMQLRNCEKGAVIRIEHGEDMVDGSFSFHNLLSPGSTSVGEFQRIIYTARGDTIETFTPAFSIFGFRYIRILGYAGEIVPGDFKALAVYSDLEETGSFECSNPLINQLVSCCMWSQKGNYMDVPTDCPTRERSPWTGDSQIYCAASAYLMDVYPFMEKWMLDFNYEQFDNGLIPSTVPNTISPHQPSEVKKLNCRVDRQSFEATLPGHMYTDPEYGAEYSDGSAGWGDAAVINPYLLYERYGDRQILENQYKSAKNWVDYMEREARKENPLYMDTAQYHSYTGGIRDADYIWDTRFHYGEWLEPDVDFFSDPDFFKKLKNNSSPQVATAYFSYSAGLLAEIARVLEKFEDMEYYSRLSKNVAKAYAKYFIHEDGSILPGRQSENLRALKFNLCQPAQEQKVLEYLVKTIVKNNYHLNTGFLSTPYLLPVLCEYGQKDLAFVLLENQQPPSWLYNIKLGATTIPEDWGGCEKHMGSFNHYSKGAVCEFLFGYVGGILPDWDKPGYKHFFLKPQIGGSLTYARAEYECIYGRIVSGWEKTAHELTYRFEVPANTSATVIIPITGSNDALGLIRNEYPLAKLENGNVQFEIGSGSYEIAVPGC